MLNRGITATEAAEAALDACAGGPAVAIVLAVDGAAAGTRMLVGETGVRTGTLGAATLDEAALALARRVLDTGTPTVEAVDTDAGRTTLYAEAHRAPEELLIVGAGHIAVPLAQIGALLGYRVTVLDDREDFATPARFPGAAAVVRADFADPFRDIAMTPRTHVVLVTRAHRYDFDCLRRLVEGDVALPYIGMVGSRRRVRAAFQALLDAGVPRERLAGIHAPIGLDIGAETPAEIAISIAAELVAVRAGAKGKPLRDHERVLDRLLPEEKIDHG
ncbi:MAG TPA: XdhC/CoxI family protein [Longimicrobiales bacterium]